MSCDASVIKKDGGDREEGKEGKEGAVLADDEEPEETEMSLRGDAVSHYAMADGADVILDKLRGLPVPTEEETAAGHSCPPAQRDALLTRSALCFLAAGNLRDAASLVRTYLAEDLAGRDAPELRRSYLDKGDGRAPSHAMFCCMLVRLCEKDAKTAPLYNWLVRNFGAELGTMSGQEVIKAYTTKIGRVYFDIKPPPSMMDVMENMMSGMGGAGSGGMMNPAAMQSMMAAMQGGGGGG